MPASEQEGQEAVDQETVPGSPEWGGVPRAGGDHADATGGPPTETDVTPDLDADADADADAGEGEGAADAGEDQADPQAGADSSTDADGGE
ncbi:MAG TPA: hypothetical protein VFR49_06300 [Solirubrobacteraceae bacterium]|nr:hypothetical protein [Solirubrobacteraceae bacterium]